MLLKRRTSQNIVWGGAAGCMPVLIGWSAVTGTVSWAAVILFLVIFFWTPPHYWPLSMRYSDDYAAAGVPMLPVVAAARSRSPGRSSCTRGPWWRRSLVLIPVASMGWVYTVAAVWPAAVPPEAHRLLPPRGRCRRAGAEPMRLFHFSITYLTVLFVAVAVDPLLHVAIG